MSTKRVYRARKKAKQKWIEGFIESNNRLPFDSEMRTWVVGFNMGYKDGRKHALNPIKQKSPYKPMLDALCKGTISITEAAGRYSLTKKKIYKLLDNYHYVPSVEEMHEFHLHEMETLREINEDNNDSELVIIRDIPDWQAKNEIEYFMQACGRAYISEAVKYLKLDIEQTIRLIDVLHKENKIKEVD